MRLGLVQVAPAAHGNWPVYREEFTLLNGRTVSAPRSRKVAVRFDDEYKWGCSGWRGVASSKSATRPVIRKKDQWRWHGGQTNRRRETASVNRPSAGGAKRKSIAIALCTRRLPSCSMPRLSFGHTRRRAERPFKQTLRHRRQSATSRRAVSPWNCPVSGHR